LGGAGLRGSAQTRVHVPDDRFDWLVDKFKPKSEVQPWLEIVDIAGLVKGASQVYSLLALPMSDVLLLSCPPVLPRRK
jgi:hypothetical protein